jgi:hypothetical protein
MQLAVAPGFILAGACFVEAWHGVAPTRKVHFTHQNQRAGYSTI